MRRITTKQKMIIKCAAAAVLAGCLLMPDAKLVFASATASSTAVTMNGGKGGTYTTLPVETSYQEYRNDPGRERNLTNLANIRIPVDKLVKSQTDAEQQIWEFSAPYYIGTDGRRHNFPDTQTYFTWYPDFSGVSPVAPEKLASIPMGTAVKHKPGVRLLKFLSSPKVYAVSAGGLLHWIKTEELAKELYGNAWKSKVDLIIDGFYINYAIGGDITTATDFEMMMQKMAVKNISADLGL